jgi:hypothetical protein
MEVRRWPWTILALRQPNDLGVELIGEWVMPMRSNLLATCRTSKIGTSLRILDVR